MPDLTPSQLRAALARLGLSQAGAAARWGYSTDALELYLAGKRRIPRRVAVLVALDLGELEPRHRELERAAAGGGQD